MSVLENFNESFECNRNPSAATLKNCFSKASLAADASFLSKFLKSSERLSLFRERRRTEADVEDDLHLLPYGVFRDLEEKELVGLDGFEPSTPALSRRCSNRLSYRPNLCLPSVPGIHSTNR